jgi:MerR family transcriptional regulator, copper efflux regulator
MNPFQDYVQIKEAAEFLSVSQNTLRNWGRDGKIAEHRHPINGYRLYKRSDLEAMLRQIEQSAGTATRMR